MLIHSNYSLKDFNTFHLNANAKFFVEINAEKEFQEIIFLEEFITSVKLFLGHGSNILFVNDFDGIVIKNSLKGITITEDENDFAIVQAAAGETWDDLVEFCVNSNLYGIENLSGIPGTVGAAPVQNIGAYGVELKDVFHSLDGFFIDGMKKGFFEANDCGFSYRNSIFKERFKGSFIISAVRLKLAKIPVLHLNYRDMREAYKDIDTTQVTLADVRKTILDIRKKKLPDPAEFGNAGSFFKNPEISNHKLKDLREKYPDIVHFKVDDKTVKIPAAWLIEKAGLKGYRLGEAATHSKQPLVIINMGNATGANIMEFAEMVQNKVKKKFQIDLIPEVNII